jgi:hypothetical protein
MSECPECGEPAIEEPHRVHAMYGNTSVCANMHRWPCGCKESRRDEDRLKETEPPRTSSARKRGKVYRHGGRKGSRDRTEL